MKPGSCLPKRIRILKHSFFYQSFVRPQIQARAEQRGSIRADGFQCQVPSAPQVRPPHNHGIEAHKLLQIFIAGIMSKNEFNRSPILLHSLSHYVQVHRTSIPRCFPCLLHSCLNHFDVSSQPLVGVLESLPTSLNSGQSDRFAGLETIQEGVIRGQAVTAVAKRLLCLSEVTVYMLQRVSALCDSLHRNCLLCPQIIGGKVQGVSVLAHCR
mmetsp:Transcript_52255/g.124625  ORF Transcript_52255/g.124625 Transcript_52255/m.124625 type:complete len:212 (+) Transcript_52255:343-978(+)